MCIFDTEILKKFKIYISVKNFEIAFLTVENSFKKKSLTKRGSTRTKKSIIKIFN